MIIAICLSKTGFDAVFPTTRATGTPIGPDVAGDRGRRGGRRDRGGRLLDGTTFCIKRNAIYIYVAYTTSSPTITWLDVALLCFQIFYTLHSANPIIV